MTHEQIIQQGRQFTKAIYDDPSFQSDQQLRKPQPPLTKAPVSSRRVRLPMDFDALELRNDIIGVILGRESHRVYTGEAMTLRELSFLLWATQGIKSIRGNNYATLRTVPCGGARHEFETYLTIRNVEGLEAGAYHYLPLTGELEFLGPLPELEARVTDSLCEQAWAAKANVVFYWSIVPYRAEWRYGIYAHRVALIDAGHICQNLYLACEALGLGTCAVAAFDNALSNALFALDGQEEYIIYTAPVGKVSPRDRDAELDFYAFLRNGD
ncbi:MAG: SagB/ThcOx family dehydrogenase [Clostridiales bacterium]|nr:SagB/ThcOx family dehydrogenase [Clostridiales bacterium]